jgi:Fe-S cluster assembly iron-binding protein IscA
MVHVTDSALNQLVELREQIQPGEGEAITLAVDQQGQLGLAVTTAQPEDEVVELGGNTLLIVPQVLVETLSSAELDFVTDSDGGGFVVGQV